MSSIIKLLEDNKIDIDAFYKEFHIPADMRRRWEEKKSVPFWVPDAIMMMCDLKKAMFTQRSGTHVVLVTGTNEELERLRSMISVGRIDVNITNLH